MLDTSDVLPWGDRSKILENWFFFARGGQIPKKNAQQGGVQYSGEDNMPQGRTKWLRGGSPPLLGRTFVHHVISACTKSIKIMNISAHFEL